MLEMMWPDLSVVDPEGGGGGGSGGGGGGLGPPQPHFETLDPHTPGYISVV